MVHHRRTSREYATWLSSSTAGGTDGRLPTRSSARTALRCMPGRALDSRECGSGGGSCPGQRGRGSGEECEPGGSVGDNALGSTHRRRGLARGRRLQGGEVLHPCACQPVHRRLRAQVQAAAAKGQHPRAHSARCATSMGNPTQCRVCGVVAGLNSSALGRRLHGAFDCRAAPAARAPPSRRAKLPGMSLKPLYLTKQVGYCGCSAVKRRPPPMFTVRTLRQQQLWRAPLPWAPALANCRSVRHLHFHGKLQHVGEVYAGGFE